MGKKNEKKEKKNCNCDSVRPLFTSYREFRVSGLATLQSVHSVVRVNGMALQKYTFPRAEQQDDTACPLKKKVENRRFRQFTKAKLKENWHLL